MKPLMYVVGAVCIAVVACQLISAAVVAVTSSIERYIDVRVNRIVRDVRSDIYTDLEKLHPSRIGHTRHGSAYVLDREGK